MPDEVQHDTALDSDSQQIGSLYGKALLAAAGDAADHIVWELGAIVDECLVAHPALAAAFASPRVSAENKEGMVDRIFRDRIHPTLLNFLKVLCRRDRIGSLRAIQTTAAIMREEQSGKVRVKVTSAQPLDDAQRGSITDRLRMSLGKEPVLQEAVDPSLVGGIVLRIGDKVIDGSVQGRISSVERMVEKNVHDKIRERFEQLTSS